jgi:hypothetical protein
MKSAQVYSIRAQVAHGFVWRWRADDHAKSSSMGFVSYEQCVADARRCGYTVAPLEARLKLNVSAP